jgi:hypothetical protein
MTAECHRNEPPARPRWKSLDQLAELWGLSRARTRIVLRGLVRSGRMEVRCLRRNRHKEREYRVVLDG